MRDASVSIWNIGTGKTLHDQDTGMWDKLWKVYLYPAERAVLFLTAWIYMHFDSIKFVLIVVTNQLFLSIKAGKESLNKLFHFCWFVSLELKGLHPIS